VRRWREAGYPGATNVTRDLLRRWWRADWARRLFFCQLEGVETLIFLAEICIPGRRDKRRAYQLSQEDLARLPGRSGRPKPEVVYREAEGALQQIASQRKERWEQMQAATPGQERVPPVLILLCDNKDIAEVFYRKISGEMEIEMVTEAEAAEVLGPDEGENGDDSGAPRSAKGRKRKMRTIYGKGTIFPDLFSNTPEVKRTIRIDTKLLAEAESDDPAKKKQEAAGELRRIVERLRDGIVPDDAEGEAPLQPILNRYKPVGTTAEVDFKTTRPCHATMRSHIDQIVLDNLAWEASAAFRLEASGAVSFYARNDHLGLTIPYEYMGVDHACEPDFLVRLVNGTTVVLEIKGFAQPPRPHQHWHIDVSHINISGAFYYYLCNALDGYSRFIVHSDLLESMTEAILRSFSKAPSRGAPPRGR